MRDENRACAEGLRVRGRPRRASQSLRSDDVTGTRGPNDAHYNVVMPRTQRRLLALIAGLAIFLIVSALIYQTGMERLEGKHRSFCESFEGAAETLSPTGYGFDDHWRHPVMVLFVIAVQFSGVFLLFLIVPMLLVPFLEERFEE